MKLLLLSILVASSRAISCDKQPELWFKLSGDELSWPCSSSLSLYESSGRYMPRNVIATRVQLARDAAYVAMPRYRPGVPFSLGVLSVKPRSNVNAPATLAAFPALLDHEEANCAAMQNVVDLSVDRHGVLWALDTGIVNGLEQPVKRCPPKVFAIDLKSSKVIKVIDLSPFVNYYSRLQHLVADCVSNDEVYLYISDAGNRGLVVYSTSNDTGFNLRFPRGVCEDSPSRDVLYLALVKKGKDTAVLYFTYLGSSRLFKIGTEKLRKGEVEGFIVDVGQKDDKIVILGTDDGSTIFFRNNGQSDVYAWDTNTDFRTENFLLAQKGSDCRLPTHVAPGGKKLIWTIESNFQDYIQNTIGSAGASVLLHPLVKSCDC